MNLTLLLHIIISYVLGICHICLQALQSSCLLGCRQFHIMPIIHCCLELITCETFSAQELFQLSEKVKVAGSRVHRVHNQKPPIQIDPTYFRLQQLFENTHCHKKAFHIADFACLAVIFLVLYNY